MSVQIDKTTSKICILIIAVLMFPLIGTLLPDDDLAKRHHRDLAEFPPAEQLVGDPVAFFQGSNKWLSDRLLFSVKSPALYRKVQFYLFRDSASDNISRNNDLIFLNSHGSNNIDFSAFLDICPEAGTWSPTVKRLNQEWGDIRRHASEKNLSAYALVIPSKPILYADQLPSTVPLEIRQACQKNASEQSPLKEFAKENSDVVYPLDLFVERRDQASFYPIQNFHFSGASADLAAKEITSHISDAEYISPPFAEEKKNADLVEMLGFERKVVVQVPQKKSKFKRKQSEAVRFGEMFGINPNQFIVTHNTAARDESKVLVLSNSFGPYVSPYIARHFSQVVQINTNRFKEENFAMAMTRLMEQENFDVVIFAMHEMGFYKRLAKFSGGISTGETGVVTKNLPMDDLLFAGWHPKRKNDSRSRWSVAGQVAKIYIPESQLKNYKSVSFDVRSFHPSGLESRSIKAEICGEQIEALSTTLSAGPSWSSVDTSMFSHCSNGFEMTLTTDEVGSPKSYGVNTDKRKLGVSITNLKTVKQ